jgi:hypothetical protein
LQESVVVHSWGVHKRPWCRVLLLCTAVLDAPQQHLPLNRLLHGTLLAPDLLLPAPLLPCKLLLTDMLLAMMTLTMCISRM